MIKLSKRVLVAVGLLAVALSGCVVVPEHHHERHGYGWHGGWHGHDRW